ncbi:glycoside hydrolase [Photobacterium sp. 2_MG-2023]|uniref:glycoside hydrolase n=1 Tax=Photobacterium sp. 2_MG-2023 TaxID=3062663 RepID=UPI0026E430AC|nr:glycoside hydrolase [Photobacterium sp. 2_MG-2023]MDO6583083.1 glycoside hydrolase [Photobacterium sp. 2_MG-2023]
MKTPMLLKAAPVTGQRAHLQPCKAILLSAILLMPCGKVAADIISLRDNDQRVEIDPELLAITWHTDSLIYDLNQAGVRVNNEKQSVSQRQKSQRDNASWLWQPSNIRVTAQLESGDLTLQFQLLSGASITRSHPMVLNWFDLPETSTTELLLPFNEGIRVPVHHRLWARYLQDEYSGSNSTQDLKMPFWTQKVRQRADSQVNTDNENELDNPARYFSYLLVNPFNNALAFKEVTAKAAETSPAVDMVSSHAFTPLNWNQPFQVLIHSGQDRLSGAIRYRRWRDEQGERESLRDKAARNPDVSKIIGASHVYLFGSDGISQSDVTDWTGLLKWYFHQSELSAFASREAQTQLLPLTTANQPVSLDRYQQRLLVESVNHSLSALFPFSENAGPWEQITDQFAAIQKRKAYLASHAAPFLLASDKWGQSLSSPVLETLKQAGLQKLWLGLDNWLPAFYQPEVVEQAKAAGYLVATYDSYNTAIDKTDNESWLTAHIPAAIRTRCAIERADGQNQAGFRGQGNYLNPGCETDYAKQRISRILELGQFNSLFLDVDATGMVREDYSDKSRLAASGNESAATGGMSQRAMAQAFNDRLEWVSGQGVLLGSEDGNSITTRGVVFAHGMETTGFGWTDKEMKHNRQSPYYLGAWYPDNKPAFFFKPATVKEPYRTLFFSPAFKVPLYQAVFHDELINNHHWHMDSLKFSDVKGIRDLTSMLYNTPPMVHLTRDEAASATSPRIKALQDYQRGFMPLHQALWDKALVGFDWLNSDGSLQRTRFSDGTQIVANFSHNVTQVRVDSQLVTLPAMSIRAEISQANGKSPKVIIWQSQ